MKADRDQGSEPNASHERHAWQLRFLTRFNRFKNLLIRRWWILLAAVLLGLGIEAILWRLDTPVFVSCGRMIVNVKLSIPEGSLYTEELNNFLGTQAALMQSAVVINRAHDRVADRIGAVDSQRVALKAVILPRTTIFVLQGTGKQERYTREFVQACMEEYINLKKEMRAQTSDSTLAGITEEVVRLEKELRKCDEDLVAFQSTNSVVLLQEQGNSAGNFLAGLNQRVAGFKSEYSLLQMLTLDQSLERQQPVSSTSICDSPGGSARPETAVLADSDYLRARQQVLLLKAEQEDLAQYLRPKHPRMLALAEEIARRERLLAIFRQQSALQLENRKESLQLQIANLEHEVKDWDARALEISRRGAEYQRLRGHAQRTQALYDRLLATMQTLDVNKQISPESVTIMEKASSAVTEHAGFTRKFLLAALGGLGFGVLLLMLLDRLDDRVACLTELQELFREEVLSQIPREKSALRKGAPSLLQPEDERFAFVEAYRNLRSSLLYMSGAGPRPKTLLVTSSVPNDGKSLTSANLAITLAGAGAQVLLVDADLRKGSLHNRFGIATAVPGLCEALSSRIDELPQFPNQSLFRRDELPRVPNQRISRRDELLRVPDQCSSKPPLAHQPPATVPCASAPESLPAWTSFVHRTKVPNLFLLPRGETTHRASELFVSPPAEGFLAEAASRYDFVILDTAPVMAADDVTSLAPHADGVIFVVRAEHSSARVARAALDLLYLRHVRVLGLVFNAVRPASADYYYYYKYKDYHGSYPAV
jgi:Mrp family chromosome partitioning ATPase